MTLTLLNFYLIKGYIYKVKKKKVGSNDGCLRYQTITNFVEHKIQ